MSFLRILCNGSFREESFVVDRLQLLVRSDFVESQLHHLCDLYVFVGRFRVEGVKTLALKLSSLLV